MGRLMTSLQALLEGQGREMELEVQQNWHDGLLDTSKYLLLAFFVHEGFRLRRCIDGSIDLP